MAPNTNHTATDDFELLARAHKGDALAARLLVMRLSPPAHKLAWRMLGDAALAEDVVQEALEKLFRIRQYQGDARLSTYFHTMVSRMCLDRSRALDPVRFESELIDDSQLASDDPAPDQADRGWPSAYGPIRTAAWPRSPRFWGLSATLPIRFCTAPKPISKSNWRSIMNLHDEHLKQLIRDDPTPPLSAHFADRALRRVMPATSQKQRAPVFNLAGLGGLDVGCGGPGLVVSVPPIAIGGRRRPSQNRRHRPVEFAHPLTRCPCRS